MKIRKYSKPIAVFLLLIMFNSIITPTFIYASGGSPSQDEFNSFQPAGSSDMVDTRTGDFNYDVPLFDVPSPEGGYPLHIFYNAGIKPEQNASWTGLGWNLNVGSITRSINGIPDDYAGEAKKFGDNVNDGNLADSSFWSCGFRGRIMADKKLGEPDYNAFGGSTIPIQYGALHAKLASAASDVGFSKVTFDCRAMYSEGDVITYSHPEMMDGGSMPCYDRYMVSGEGLSGMIEPVILDNGSLFRTNARDNSIFSPATYYTRQYTRFRNYNVAKQQFRFKNEFSNSFYATSTNMFTTGTPSTLTFTGTNAPGYNYAGPDGTGYNSTSERLAGGKHVDFFLNEEITDGTTAKNAGFMDYPDYFLNGQAYKISGVLNSNNERVNITRNSKTYAVGKRVGGYSILNEDGTTYHYALPIYTYQNVKTQILNTSSKVGAIRPDTNNAPFASSWLLTTITGSDFVDKNNNGYADEGDIGKWVNFNYGKATPNYYYASPFANAELGYDSIAVKETGYIELYFLDAVYTRSHTALLSKASRVDGLDANNTASALKLNSAILFSNDGIKSISTGMGWTWSGLYNAVKSIKGANTSANTSVITTDDISTITSTYGSYSSQILKESKLYYDYSLCKNAYNSQSGNGKLTLDSVRTFGRNGSALAPSTIFKYDLKNPQSATITLSSTAPFPNIHKDGVLNVTSTPNPFSVGDVITFNLSGVTYYGFLMFAYASNQFQIMFLGPNIPPFGVLSTSTTATQTKNPPYTYYIDNTKGYYGSFQDQWGYFKPDIMMDYAGIGIANRKQTASSSKAVDCWSLREITTPTGGTISMNYESDSYYGYQMIEGEIFNINPNFRYTDATTSTLISSSVRYCDFRNVKNDTSAVFEFSINEDMTGKFSVGQTVDIASLATFTDNTGSGTIHELTSSFGRDQFYITYVDATNQLIQGKFRKTSSGTQSNPFWTWPWATHSNTRVTVLYPNCSFLVQRNPTLHYGGGLRVTSITVKEGNGEYYSTNYSYNGPSGNTSGTVPYEPVIENPLLNVYYNGTKKYSFDPNNIYYDTDNGLNTGGDTLYRYAFDKYSRNSLDVVKKSMANLDFISPWVLYEYTTVSHSGNGNTYLKSEEYRYQPYTWNSIQRLDSNTTTVHGELYQKRYIQDYTSAVGQLLTYTEYDAQSNPVSQTTYQYTAAPPSNQGRLDQVFHEERLITFDAADPQRQVAIITVYSRFPSVIQRITTTDFLKNLTTFKDYYKFDFYSGNPIETVSKDSYGQYFKQKLIPAYTKSQYSGMGLKMVNTLNKNILNPVTGSYTYKVNSSNYSTLIDTLNCSIDTWSNNWTKRAYDGQKYYDSTITDNSGTVQDDRIWRKQSTYLWKSPILNSNGSYKNFVDFNWSGSNNANWQQVKTVTKYDQFSNAIEAMDINGNYTCAKYGYDFNYPLTVSDNASYNELAYSGAEDINSSSIYGSTSYFGSEIGKGGGTQDNSVVPHTGSYVLKLTASNTGFNYRGKVNTGGIVLGKTYRATVWQYADGNNTSANLFYKFQDSTGATVVASGSVSLATATNIVSSGAWKQLTIDFTLPTGAYTNYQLVLGVTNPSGFAAYFDDFRFHPITEIIKSNVYDKPSGLLTHTLDGNNFYTRRVYDNMFRPSKEYKETINGLILKREYNYNYGRGN
jgi:hypothetical protein